MRTKKIRLDSFQLTLVSVVFSCALIFVAYLASGATLTRAQQNINPDYYSYSDYPGHYVCYICPTPPPGGGGGECNDNGICEAGENINNCASDCQGSSSASPQSNLAQSYAYDDAGYRPGSDCPDFEGAWQECPNQPPPPQCTPFCTNACGGSDGCGGTCGSACTIGCASASDPNLCPQIAGCQSPTTQTRPADGTSTAICGTGLKWDTSNNQAEPYEGYNLSGTVTQTNEKIGTQRYVYHCNQYGPATASDPECGSDPGSGLIVAPGFAPDKIVPGNTDNTGTYYTEAGWWDVAMVMDGYQDCEANDAGGYAVYPPASSYFKNFSKTCVFPTDVNGKPYGSCTDVYGVQHAYTPGYQSAYPGGQCSHISYACIDSSGANGENNTDSWFACGNQNLGSSSNAHVPGFSPSMVQHSGHASYFNEQAQSSGQLGQGPTAASTHIIGNHDSKINGWPINGWIPKGQTWYVYRETVDCPWSPVWSPQTATQPGDYSSCEVPPLYAPYGAPYGVSAITCPDNTAGLPISKYTYTRDNPTTSSALTEHHAADYGFCYAAPSNFTATQLSCGAGGVVNLTWNAVNDPKHGTTRYVLRKDGAIVSNQITGTSYEVVPGSGDHTYTISVISDTYGPESGRTGPTVTGAVSQVSGVSSYCDPPTAPSNLSATVYSQYQINLSWSDNSTNESGFKIERFDNYDWAAIATVGANTTTYSNTGLSPDTIYYYRVKAVKGVAESAPSNVDDATTSSPSPGTPGNFTATPDTCGTNAIEISWSTVPGATVYALRRDGVYIYYNNYPSYRDVVPEPNTTYEYSIRSSNNGGSSEYVYTTAVSPQLCPVTATGFTATVPSVAGVPACGARHLDLAWYAQSNADTFTVKDGSTTVYSGDGSQLWNGTNYAFSPTGLLPSSSHSYSITYTNAISTETANANPSYPVAVQPVCAPNGLVATTQSPSAIRLDWSWEDSYGSSPSFIVERSLDGSSGWTDVTASCTPALQDGSYWCSISGLSANTKYYFRIKNVNVGVSSSYTVSSNATTLPAALSTVSATTVSSSRIDLSWSSGGSGLTYNIYRKSTGSYILVDTTTSTTYQDTGRSANTTYTYKISATNSVGGTSAYSNEPSATTYPDLSAAAPTPWTEISGLACGSGKIRIGWYPVQTTSSYADSYKVYRGTPTNRVLIYSGNGTNNGASYGDASNSFFYFVDSGQDLPGGKLADGTSYNYYITYSNASGESNPSAQSGATFTQPMCSPSAPGNFRSTSVTNNTINLAWDSTPTATSYNLYRSTANTKPSFATVSGLTGTTYSDTGRSVNTTYYYWLTASNANPNESTATASVSATTYPNLASAPQLSAGSAGYACDSGKLWINWYPVQTSSAYADYYKIYRNTTSANSGGTLIYTGNGNQADVNGTGYTATLQGDGTFTLVDDGHSLPGGKLGNDSTYYYYAVSYNVLGAGTAGGNSGGATTQPMCAPSAPTGLQATAVSSTQINLSWNAAPTATSYNLYRSTTSTKPNSATIFGITGTTYQDTGRQPNTTYYYWVTASNLNPNESSAAGPQSATTNPGVPGVPSNTWAATGSTCSSKRIDIGWYPSADASTYQIYRGTQPSGTLIYSGNGTNSGATAYQDQDGFTYYIFPDTVSADGTTYNYYIRASNVTGSSAAYVFSGTSPQICLPSAPTNLTATAVSQTQINLSWTDNSTNETGFTIQRSTNGSSFIDWDFVGAGVTTYNDNNYGSGLSNSNGVGTQYWYRVRSTNDAGGSPNSNTATTYTLMNPPTSLAITASTNPACGTNKIDLVWSATGATSYTVTESGTGRVVVSNVTATSVSDTVSTPNSSHTYILTANATNAGGTVSTTKTSNSALSAQVCAPTSSGFTSTVPTSPTCGANWINIAFYNTNADRYIVKRNGTTIFDQLAGNISWQPDGGSQYYAFSDPNLTPGSTHNYTLTLVNAGGSTNVNANPRYPETVQSQCTAPTVTLQAGSPSVAYGGSTSLTWTPSGQEIASCTAGGGWSGNKSPSGGSTTTPNLTSATTYTIYCTNPGGNSNTASVTVTPSSLGTPTNLTATVVSQTQVNLSWTAPTQPGHSGYKIWRKEGLNGSYGTTPIATVLSGVTSYNDTSLTADTLYYYRVSSYNGSDNSPYSNEVGANTTPNIPTAPSSFTATPGACGTGTIALNWGASSNGPTSYVITDTAVGGHRFTVLPPALTVTDSGLIPESAHTYKIEAVNVAGTSTAVFTTPGTTNTPALCTDLSFSTDDVKLPYNGDTTLRWTPNNATSCTASANPANPQWSGAKSTTANTQAISDLTTTTIFNLSCVSAGGTVNKSVTVTVLAPSVITVNSNVNASWTITPGNLTGSGSGVQKTVIPAVNGTSYSISAASVAGYDDPSITNSVGPGVNMTLFGGEQASFTLNYARAFNYNLSNGGDVHVQKGGSNQFGQVTITKSLAANSGPTRPVDLTLGSVPTGVSASISGTGCAPDCNSSITFTVTPQAIAGTYPMTVTGSPLDNKKTSFNLIITDSPDLIVSCGHTPATAQVGETVTWTAQVSQSPSLQPYSFSWSGSNIPENTNDQSFNIAYTTTGLKTAEVTVRDSLNNVAHCSSVGTIQIGVNPQFQEF